MTKNDQSGRDALDRILTLPEVASYLRFSEKTVLRMIQNNEIPAIKIASQWRFVKAMIDDWLTSKLQTVPSSTLVDFIETEEQIIPLSRFITRERIIPSLASGSKEEVLRQLAAPLADQGMVGNFDSFLQKLIDREAMVTTGIGGGIAIPHAREPEESTVLETCAVIGVCRKGTDFMAMDGEPTYIFVLLCATSEVAHVRLLAKTSFMLRQDGMVEQLKNARDGDEILSLIIGSDVKLSMSI